MARKKKDPVATGEQNITEEAPKTVQETTDTGQDETSTESTREKMRKIAEDAIKKNAKIVEQLGGKEAVLKRMENTKELAEILFSKKSASETINGIIDLTLEEFRTKVSKLGYKGISKDMIPIVETYGTIKDKTVLAVLAHFDSGNDCGTPIIPREEADEIKESIRNCGRDAMVEFMNYLAIFSTLQKSKNLLFFEKNRYLACGYTTALYLNTYEWLGKAEDFFNSVSPLIAEDKKEDFKKIAREYNDYLQHFQTFGELEEKGDGWVDKQRGNCLEYATDINKIVKESLSEYKGAVDAFKKWIKDNKAEMLVPMALREQIEFSKIHTEINELQSKFHHYHLQTIKDSGREPTEEEKKIAIFPLWEEVDPDKKVKKQIIQKIDEYRQIYK